MSARKKLNTIFFSMATGIAAIFGIMTKSLIVFLVCLFGFTAAFLHDSSIRPDRRKR